MKRVFRRRVISMLMIFSMLLTVFLPSAALAEDVAENLDPATVVTAPQPEEEPGTGTEDDGRQPAPQNSILAANAVDVTLTMAEAVVTEEEVREDGLTLVFAPESGYEFDPDSMSWADGKTAVGSNVTFTPTYPSGVNDTQQAYVSAALAAATATVTANELTITVPAFDAAFTNFVSGANVGDITIEVSLPAGSVALTDDGAAVEAALAFEDNTATIQEVKAIVYVEDGSGQKVDLKESDIRSGAERYIVIEQQGNAGGSSSWTLVPSKNGWTRRPSVATNTFATDVNDMGNEDAGTEWAKIEDFWCQEDDSVENPVDPSDQHRYYSLEWINCEENGDTLKFKVPQIADFSIEEDLTIYGRMLRGMVGGTGGGAGNPSLEPYWGTNGLMNFTIADDVDDSNLKEITAFEALDPEIANQTVEFNTTIYNLSRPKSIKATVDGNTVEMTAGTFQTASYWEQSPAYNGQVAGTYTFTYKYNMAEYKLAADVEAPKVTVTVLPGVLASLNEYATEYRVVQGTPLEELPLPATLSGKVGYTTVNSIPVTWVCDGEYNPEAEVGTTFTFKGTIDATKFDASAVTVADIKVTLTESAEISACEEPGIWETKQLVPIGTALEDLNRPNTLTATVNGQETEIGPVYWQSEPEYDRDTAGVYTFSPLLPEGYVWAEGVEPPTLQVEVRQPDLSIGTTEEFVEFINSSDGQYDGMYDGQLVVLTDDIDMYGQRLNGRMEFLGTFDGQGHRIYNLNNNTGSFSYLFYELGTSSGNYQYVRNVDDAVIRNTKFEGGASRGTGGNTVITSSLFGTIDRCAIEWDVYSSSGDSAIANTMSGGSIVNSYAILNMQTFGTGRANWHGGFVGQSVNGLIDNSYIIQHSDVSSFTTSNQQDPIIGRVRDNANGPTVVDNVYYVNGAIPGVTTPTTGGGTQYGGTELASANEFAVSSMVDQLNDSNVDGPWRWDATGENGYAPVLKWEENAGDYSSPPQLYGITENIVANNAATGVVLDVNPVVQAAEGETVTVRAYVDGVNTFVSGLTVETGSGEPIEVETVSVGEGISEFTFEMPAHRVIISAAVSDNDYPLEITSVADWQKFAEAVNNGHDYAGETVMLSANLDFSGVEDLQPVGTVEYPFNGALSGTVTFSNVNINLPEQDNVGLFGVVGPEGNISGITLDGANITGRNNVGGLIGLCQGVVSDVTVGLWSKKLAVSVKGEDCVGGVIGYLQVDDKDLTIDNIVVDYRGEEGIQVDGSGRVGALFGAAHGSKAHPITITGLSVYRFHYDGAAESVGLFAGELKHAVLSDVITSTYDDFSIQTSGTTAGGLVGAMLEGAVVRDCVAVTTTEGDMVSAAQNAGGIAGVMADGALMENCFAYGSISGGSHAGGLVGDAQSGSIIQNCYAFTGSVTASYGTAGAVAGSASGKVENTYAFARMTVDGINTGATGEAVDMDRILVKKDIYESLGENWTQEDMYLPYFGKNTNWRIAVPAYMNMIIEDTEINTPEELYDLAISVATGATYQGVTFTLGADLDMSGVEMLPIGATKAFQGSFDGKGHTISNLTIAGEYDYAGLFGQVKGSAEHPIIIKDFTLENVDINAPSRAAAVAGYASDGVSFENIHLKEIDLRSPARNVSNEIGGIVGWYRPDANGYSIKNCTVDGLNIAAEAGTLGGIAANINYATPMEVSNCHVKNAEFSTAYDSVGGLIGELGGNAKDVNVKNCSVTDTTIRSSWYGEIRGALGMADYYLGGLIGSIMSGATVDSCQVEADIIMDATSQECSVNSGIGGLIGRSNYTANFTGNSFTGSIRAKVPNVGGILGTTGMQSQFVNNCYVNAELTGTSKVGGVLGASGYGASIVQITNSYVLGSVYAAESYAGGFVGGNGASTPATVIIGSYALLSSVTAGNSAASDTVGPFGGVATAQPDDWGSYYYDGMYLNASETAKETLPQGDGTVTADEALQAATYTNNSWTTPWVLEDGKLPYFAYSGEVAAPAYFTGATITGFAALAPEVANQTIAVGAAATLPASLTATVDGAETKVPVTWTCQPEYSWTEAGSYTFTAKLGNNYTVADDVTLPTITVTTVPVYTITMTVTPAEATVVVKDAAGQTVAANADGAYRLMPGEYTYTATADGYQTKTGSFTVSADAALEITLTKGGGSHGGGGGSSSSSTTEYTLTFNTNGGSSITAVKEAANSKIDLADYKPTREGYTFAGWYADAELTEAVSSITLTENTTVYAKWTEGTETPSTGLPFTDVAANAWYFNAVNYAYENGLMNGTDATTFSPNASTTRGMIVTILYRLENSPAVSQAAGFTDVAESAYYADPVAWAAANGIVKGYSETQFGPNDAITREQLAQILYGYATYKGYDTTQAGMAIREFNDYEKISDWALTAMTWANAAGLVNGMEDNTLNPQGTATRAEVATMLQRFAENIAQ